MRPFRASQLRSEKLSAGCPRLDAFLRGGISCDSVTELTGEAGAAKTQLCLQLLLSVAAAGLQGKPGSRALYLYTEGEPAVSRLEELATHKSPGASQDLLDRIFVERHVHSPDELFKRLESISATLQRGREGERLKLIIIDSVAHLFRDPGEGKAGAQAYSERASFLFQLSAVLKRLATQHQLAVVVINQVTDVFTDSGGEAAQSHTAGLRLVTSGRQVAPALGLAWANCVNTRLFLSRAPGYGEPGGQEALRSLQVVFSPSLPQSYCYFKVYPEGLRGIEPERQQQPSSAQRSGTHPMSVP